MLVAQRPTKLADLFGCDLAGYQIAYCHFLELDHNLMGFFPAIYENRDIIVTLNKCDLEGVWKKLPRRPAKITSFLVLVQSGDGISIGFDIAKENNKPFRIFSPESIESLCKRGDERGNPVSWTPGLIPLSNPSVRDPIFV